MSQLTIKTEYEGKNKTVTIPFNGNNYDKVLEAVQKAWPDLPKILLNSAVGKVESNEEWKKALNDALKKKQDYVHLTIGSSSYAKAPSTTTSASTSTPPSASTAPQTKPVSTPSSSATTSSSPSSSATTSSSPAKTTTHTSGNTTATITQAPTGPAKQGPPPAPKGELLTAFELDADTSSKEERPTFDTNLEGQAFTFIIIPGKYKTSVSIYQNGKDLVYRCEYQKTGTTRTKNNFESNATFQQTFELPEPPKEDNVKIIPGKPAPKVQISFD